MNKAFIDDFKIFIIFRFISAISVFLLLYLLPKYLPPNIYGKYSLIYSSILILTSLLITWLSSSILRYNTIDNDKSDKDSFVNRVVFITITYNIILFFILKILALIVEKYILVQQELFSYTNPILIWLVLYNTFTAMLSYFRANRKIYHYGILNSWQLLGVLFFLQVYFSIFENKLYAVIMSYITSYSLALIYIIIYFLKNYNFNIRFLVIKDLKVSLFKYLTYGLPLCFLGLFSQSISTSDRFFMSYFWGNNFTGIYSATYNISEQSIFIIVSIFSTISAPILYQLWINNSKSEIITYLRGLKKNYQLVTMPLVVLLISFKNQIILLLFGLNYLGSSVIVPFISIGAYFIGLAALYTDILTSEFKTSKLMLCYLLVLLINGFFNFLLIPINAYYGASISTLISGISMYIIIIYFTRDIILWDFNFASSLKITISNVILYFIIYILKYYMYKNNLIEIVLISIISLFFYLFLLIQLKEVNTIPKYNFKLNNK